MRVAWRTATESPGAWASSPATQPTSGSEKGAISSLSQFGSARQSPSTKANTSPLPSAMPRLRALETPGRGSCR